MDGTQLKCVKRFSGIDGNHFLIFVFFVDGMYVPVKMDCDRYVADVLVSLLEDAVEGN